MLDHRGFKSSRFPNFTDNQLTDGGYIISLTRRPRFTPQEDFWYSFLLEAKSTPGPQCGWKEYISLRTKFCAPNTMFS
jgi:hypothetical protein